MRKNVTCGLAINSEWVPDYVKVLISTDPRKLNRSITSGIDTKGLVVMPVICFIHYSRIFVYDGIKLDIAVSYLNH